MTLMEERLKEALDARAVDNYVWKGPKVNDSQEEIKLIDADFYQLQKFYNHCMEMLYNNDSKNPGRLVLLNIVQDQIYRCRAELLIRWLRSEKRYTATNCLEDLRGVLNTNKDRFNSETIKTLPIDTVMSGLPVEYERIPISLVMDACLDSLGVFSNKHLSLNFITKMGFWFTPQEMQKSVDEGGLYVKNPETGKATNRLDVLRKKYHINPDISLRISNTGLTLEEFDIMYKLKTDKYANLTSKQLKLLSNKILYKFQDRCELQAKTWQDKIDEILKVAETKGWDVTRNIE
jgi:hypothetical protein